jgi:hypothetical protein
VKILICIIFRFYVTEKLKVNYNNFYTMKSIVLLIVTSLMLVGAIIVVAIPSPIQAAPPHQWCFREIAGPLHCFANKGDCKKGDDLYTIVEECHKETGPT